MAESLKYFNLNLQIDSIPGMKSKLTKWSRGESGSKLVGFINPHVFTISNQISQVGSFLDQCDLVVFDGIGTSLVARLLLGKKVERIIANKLFDDLISDPSFSGEAILIGTSEKEVQNARKRINMISPGVHIKEAFNGFYSDEEYSKIFSKHRNIDFVLIGMGTPRSETVLLQAKRICRNSICWHIGGGSIRVYAGTKSFAPKWISKIGMEWFHRFVFEPATRTRYLSELFLFPIAMIKQKLKSLNLKSIPNNYESFTRKSSFQKPY